MQFLNNSRRDDYYWMWVKGDSMSGDGLDAGDLILVCLESDVPSGTIAVVTIDNEEGTVKRVIKKKNMIILQPSNPSYEPQVFVGEDMNRIRIVAEVIESRKDFKRTNRYRTVHESPGRY